MFQMISLNHLTKVVFIFAKLCINSYFCAIINDFLQKSWHYGS